MPRITIPAAATIAALLTLGLAAPTLAHDYRLGDLHIDHPWARATAPQQPNGGAYLAITNAGTTADRLLEAESPVAERVELHTHDVDSEGVMRMRQVDAIDVPAGETTALRPGGLHVMLIGLEDRLVQGEQFPLTLVFEAAGPIEVEVTVEPVTYGVGEAPAMGEGHAH
jgi:periplasmic copper chaperone A